MKYLHQCIEIPMLLLYFSIMLPEYITTHFILYRTCTVVLGYNVSDCELLGTKNATKETQDLEQNVQPVASLILMSRTIIDSIIPVFCCFIIGPWSNKHGRKPILISSFLGFVITFIAIVFISWVETISPWWWLVIPVLATCGGGLYSMLAVCYCYITDITTEENRSFRMGVLEVCISIGSVCGTFASSYIFFAVGYVGLFIVCTVLIIIATLYIYFCISESLEIVDKKDKFKDLYDVSYAIKTIKICFKPRENKIRLLLCLLILITVIYLFVVTCNDALFFLFIREKFHWTLTKYTLYSGVMTILDIVVTAFVLLVLQHFFKITDMAIILCGFILLFISSIIFGIAEDDQAIYVGSFVKGLNGAVAPLLRSVVSKIIPPEDLGYVFAFTTSLSPITQSISTPLCTLLYNVTLNTQPGAFNFLSATMFALNVIVTSFVIYIRNKSFTHQAVAANEI